MNYTYIYGLLDTRNEYIRYIGKSDNPEKRVFENGRNSHMDSARKVIRKRKETAYNGTKKENWLASMLEENLLPKIIILEKVTNEEWREKEKYWIKKYRKISGILLTNGTEGGEGFTSTDLMGSKNPNYGGLSEEHKRKLRENHKGMTGQSQSEETKRKISASAMGRKHSEETKQKMRESQRKRRAV